MSYEQLKSMIGQMSPRSSVTTNFQSGNEVSREHENNDTEPELLEGTARGSTLVSQLRSKFEGVELESI